jgi:EAL domain-containing protein (putative c-di-GMP-specific phosphodiesterase class I)
MIVELGAWALTAACREAASWKVPLQVAVNLSPVQFCYGDLAGLVHLVLLETGLSPGRLELEITEGVIFDDPARALSILRRLKALGVKIAMDDFGTGYASMSSLQSFPFDKIKIDRTFVSGVEFNSQSAAIVRSIIGLGTALQIPVIAEGVETEGECAFLRQEGCGEIQGFLIGRPLPISEYAAITEGASSRRAKAG